LIAIPSPADMPTPEALEARGVIANWLLVRLDQAGLEGLARILQDESLRVFIADSQPLAEMAALHVISESSSVTGKLVATLAG